MAIKLLHTYVNVATYKYNMHTYAYVATYT